MDHSEDTEQQTGPAPAEDIDNKNSMAVEKPEENTPISKTESDDGSDDTEDDAGTDVFATFTPMTDEQIYSNMDQNMAFKNITSFVKKATLDKVGIGGILGKDTRYLCAFFNDLLATSPLAKTYLPLMDHSLHERLADGVLLCAIANALKPNTVEEDAVSVGAALEGPERDKQCWYNINLGLLSLRSLGIDTIDEERWIKNGSCSFPVTGILLQAIRLWALNQVNLRENEKLIYTQPENELSYIKSQPREQLLLRWINYQLYMSGEKIRMANFDYALRDSNVYARLLKAIVPKNVAPFPFDIVMAEKDATKRAEKVVFYGVHTLKIPDIISAEHIVNATEFMKPKSFQTEELIYTMNLAFIAHLYTRYPNIEPPKEKAVDKISLQAMKKTYKRGSMEESMLMWLNSFGPSSPVIFLDTDLRNGLTLLQVTDVMIPGLVDWSKVGPVPLNTEHYKQNIAIVLDVLKPQPSVSAEEIAQGKTDPTVRLIMAMMRCHTQNARRAAFNDPKLPDLDDKALVVWFNQTMQVFGSNLRIASIDDPQLRATNALGFITERVLSSKDLLGNTACFFGQPGTSPGTRLKKSPKEKIRDAAKKLDEKAKKLFGKPKRGQPTKKDKDTSSKCSSTSSSADDLWLFECVKPLSKKKKERREFTSATLSMLRQAGVLVHTVKLGPKSHVSIYRNILIQLSTLAQKS